MQEVKIYVGVFGDYCAFHEMSFSVMFDVTNNLKLGDMSLEELENWDYDACYSDYEVMDGIKIGDKYYLGL